MGYLTPSPWSPYDPGARDEIYTLDPFEPTRNVGGGEPPPPPVGLLGLIALGLGYWASRRSLSPDSPAMVGAPSAPTQQSNKPDLESQRRVSGLTDQINGGVEQVTQNGPATVNRATQLAGLPNGGLTFGQRTPFPPISTGGSVADLPAVLRGANIGQNADGAPWQAPSYSGAIGWQNFVLPPRADFDFPDIPDFLRRVRENNDDNTLPPQRQRSEPTNSGGGAGGSDGGGTGGNEDDCGEEIKQAREICIDAYANGWKGDYSGWRSDYRVDPYQKESGGPWTIQDCMKGFLRKECGGEDPNDPENWNKLVRRSRRPGRR